MKKGGRLGIIGLSGILRVSSIKNISCTPPVIPPEEMPILEQKAESSGYVAGFEGMQPFSGYRVKELTDAVVTAGIAGCSTTWNPFAHLEYAERAHKRGMPVYAIGYSSGGNDARAFAELCKNKGIPVRALILLDPTWLARPLPAKIPSNVEKVYCYMSMDEGIIYGVRATRENLENPDKTILMPAQSHYVGHLDLPRDATEDVRMAIINSAGR